MIDQDIQDIRTLIMREILRSNIAIGEFEGLGRFFPDVALHYIYCSFDSLAHAEFCPCDSSVCENCICEGMNEMEIKYDFMRSAFSAAATADSLTQKFLVVDYEKRTRQMLNSVSVRQSKWMTYLETNASNEERKNVDRYLRACEAHDDARFRLRGFLEEEYQCGDEAMDLYDLFEETDVAEAEDVISAFRCYASTAREMYLALHDVIPIRQRVRSQELKKLRIASAAGWIFVAINVLNIIGTLLSRG